MRNKSMKTIAGLSAIMISAASLAGCGGTNAAKENVQVEGVLENPSTVVSGSEEGTKGTDETVTDTNGADKAESNDKELASDSNGVDKSEATGKEASNAENASSENKESKSDSSTASWSKTDSGVVSSKDVLKGEKSALPPYEYPGPEAFYSVVYKYVTEVLGKGYLKGDVTIPCPIIVTEDESDKSDIKVWGNFSVYNYSLSGDTLMTISGGNHPGLMHLKLTDAGYEVTGFDAVKDGSDYEKSAKEIFGEHYDAFLKAEADEKTKDNLRAQIISDYSTANNLGITGYQDYGWEKKAFPTDNNKGSVSGEKY